MSLVSGGVISAIAAIAVGIMLAHASGTSVRDRLRPLARLRPDGGQAAPSASAQAGQEAAA
jgi:hypothetical protein